MCRKQFMCITVFLYFLLGRRAPNPSMKHDDYRFWLVCMATGIEAVSVGWNRRRLGQVRCIAYLHTYICCTAVKPHILSIGRQWVTKVSKTRCRLTPASHMYANFGRDVLAV
ncbi:hypothetical protein F4803DRAFT_334225 [Xylaria telfairii]|nr:hypothetical protein F4803DRAFT_334225 [Xylaria telfairii]